MSDLEREIIEKFRQLSPEAKQRIRAVIDQEADAELSRSEGSAFDYNAWLNDVKALRQHVRAKHGDKQRPIDLVGMPNDIRDGK
jgi:hypothetical protein